MDPAVQPNIVRAMRIIHLALLMGLVLCAGTFYFLIRMRGASFGLPNGIGLVTAAITLVMLTVALAFLLPRMPSLSTDESLEAYWSREDTRGAAIVLWAIIEGAALVSLIGYLATGTLAPAVAAVLAIGAMFFARPSRFEAS